MDMMTTKEAAALWGISMRQVQLLCERDRVDGAIKFGDSWAIPKDAAKPIDGRTKAAKESMLKSIGD